MKGSHNSSDDGSSTKETHGSGSCGDPCHHVRRELDEAREEIAHLKRTLHRIQQVAEWATGEPA
ncbi:hypothetical protein EKK97_04845 [Billgrantia tianxiuensis]|uniref:Uncharacterized protein n=1 Tax=Billgrantia tianxiuensis TaxID=2497861 RepID=A0A6I6SKE8_9GAMM|nr:hypothetical protein [Halomonas tianxiuensis]QHC49076.1 hypothetical protein EKK97_04845 [Halomonas tianxiuensis]